MITCKSDDHPHSTIKCNFVLLLREQKGIAGSSNVRKNVDEEEAD
jgi:hypothetical protein